MLETFWTRLRCYTDSREPHRVRRDVGAQRSDPRLLDPNTNETVTAIAAGQVSLKASIESM